MPLTAIQSTGPIKPEPGILQWGDPLADELIRLFPFDRGEDDVGSTDFEELVVGADLTKPGSPSLEWAVDETGRIVQYDGVGSISTAYASSTDPPFTSVKDQAFSFLWSGIINSAAASTLQALLSMGSHLTTAHFAVLEYNNAGGADEIRWRIRHNTTTTIVIDAPPQDRRIVCIGVNDPAANELRLYVDGRRGLATIPTYTSTIDLSRLHLNARQQGIGLVDHGIQSCSILAIWLRALDDGEALRLTFNPMLLLEREPYDDLLCQPYYRQLTQPAFPFTSESERAVDSSDPRSIGVLIAAKSNRINERTLSLRLTDLNPDERSLLEDLFDNGRGLVEPFWVNIPDEGARRMILKTSPLAIIDRSAVHAEAAVELIDVTDPLDF